MKKNYLYILVIVGYIVFSGCTRKYSVTLVKTLDNTTNKEIYYEVKTEIGVKGIYIGSVSTDSVVFYYEGSDVVVAFPVDFWDEIRVNKESIYNLTDTTKFEYNYITHSVVEDSEADLMFYKIKTTYNNKNTYIELTDAFLQLLSKDYSMLEKFPDYYGN